MTEIFLQLLKLARENTAFFFISTVTTALLLFVYHTWASSYHFALKNDLTEVNSALMKNLAEANKGIQKTNSRINTIEVNRSKSLPQITSSLKRAQDHLEYTLSVHDVIEHACKGSQELLDKLQQRTDAQKGLDRECHHFVRGAEERRTNLEKAKEEIDSAVAVLRVISYDNLSDQPTVAAGLAK